MQFVKAARLLAAPLIVVLASLSWSSVSWAGLWEDGYASGYGDGKGSCTVSCPICPAPTVCPAETVCPAPTVCPTQTACPAPTVCPAETICPAPTVCPTTLTVVSNDTTLGTVTQALVTGHTNTYTLTAKPQIDVNSSPISEFKGWDCTPSDKKPDATNTIAISVNTVCVAKFVAPTVAPNLKKLLATKTETASFKTNAKEGKYYVPTYEPKCSSEKSTSCAVHDKAAYDVVTPAIPKLLITSIDIPVIEVTGSLFSVGMKSDVDFYDSFTFYVDNYTLLQKLTITGTGLDKEGKPIPISELDNGKSGQGGTVSVLDASGKSGQYCGKDCYAFPMGTTVTVTATPFSGVTSGTITPSITCDSQQNPTVILDKDKECKVEFKYTAPEAKTQTATTTVTLDYDAKAMTLEATAGSDCKATTTTANQFISTTGTCGITVKATVKATPVTVTKKTLTVLSNDNTLGKVKLSGKECTTPYCSESFEAETKKFTLAAEPTSTSVTWTWEGAEECKPDAKGELTVSKDTVCIAKFTKTETQYKKLTLKTSGAGTVLIPAPPQGVVPGKDPIRCTTVSEATCEATATLPQGTEFTLVVTPKAPAKAVKSNTCEGKQTLDKEDKECVITFE